MAADGQFGALLQALQIPHAQYESQRYLGAALSSLLSLNNPLNITLLTSQLLTAPVLWTSRRDSDLAFSFLSLYHTAVAKVEARDSTHSASQIVALDKWVKAVTHSIDDRSPPARHVLVLGGILIGLGDHAHHGLPWRQLSVIQAGFIDAVNAAAQDPILDQSSQTGLILALTHVFTFLPPNQLARLDHDALVPGLMHALLHSSEGLDSLDVLRTIDQHVVQSGPTQFVWDPDAPSFLRLQQLSSRPLVRALGPLARLIAHSIEHVRGSALVLAAIEDVRDTVVLIHSHWYATKLSEVDASEETTFLSLQTVQQTLPALTAIFRSVLFAAVIVLRGTISRSFCDANLANTFVAPRIAQDVLTTLRHLHFILARLSATFTQHEYLHLAALDILNAYPSQTADYLSSIAPNNPGTIPAHPLDRSLNHFFFNTLEHCPAHAAPYLHTTSRYLSLTSSSPSLVSIVEAAHSLTLSIFAADGNEVLVLDRLPAYTDILRCALQTASISDRQFIIAFKLLVKAANKDQVRLLDPALGDVLMEILYHGVITSTKSAHSAQGWASHGIDESNKATHLNALVESFPHTHPDSLESWLELAAQAISTFPKKSRLESANKLWDVIYGGQMGDLRTQICVVWWVHKGGRELVFGPENVVATTGSGWFRQARRNGGRREKEEGREFLMSGALPPTGSARL